MSVNWSFALAVYFTFSIAIACYAFRHFRKRKESMTFSVIGSFMLIFLWWIPALTLLKKKIKSV
jgi:hypothetical protein